MKKFWKEFLLRGLICAGGGPLVLAVIYGILGATGAVNQLSPSQVCIGILTIMLLAFITAGMTAVYQVEQLPLPTRILLHGGALYIAYILTYLINGWLQQSLVPILVFTGIFAGGYGLIWLIVYWVERSKAEAINKKLRQSP
ncbi:MAG: DUF3021 domain-containing protein [Oscillospiraceae bacterium]|nr:DUF3021 domain-containing protein [Oscillospiraceae bacterium]